MLHTMSNVGPSPNEQLRCSFERFLREEPLQEVVRVVLRRDNFDATGELVSTQVDLVLACGHIQADAFTPRQGPAAFSRCPRCYQERISKRAQQVEIF